MDPIKEKFECWAIVELMGHQKIAGKCTEQNIAGINMLRVDVPEVDNKQSFSKLYGSAAIYAITPVDEITAKHLVSKLSVEPIMHWDINEIMKKQASPLLLDDEEDDDNVSEGDDEDFVDLP